MTREVLAKQIQKALFETKDAIREDLDTNVVITEQAHLQVVQYPNKLLFRKLDLFGHLIKINTFWFDYTDSYKRVLVIAQKNDSATRRFFIMLIKETLRDIYRQQRKAAESTTIMAAWPEEAVVADSSTRERTKQLIPMSLC